MLHTFINGKALQQHLSQSNAVGFFVYDIHLNLLEWNHYMEFITGKKRSSCIGKSVFEIIATYSATEDEPGLRSVLKGKSALEKNKALIVNELNDTVQHFNFLYIPLCDEQGVSNEVMVMVFESAEQEKKAWEQQKATLSTLRSFLQFAPMPVYIIDRNFKIQMASKSFNWYIKKEKSVGKKLESLFSPGAVKILQKRIQRIMDSGKAEVLNESFELNDRLSHFFTVRFPIYNASGKVEAVGGYSLDITDRVKQEEKIQDLLEQSLSMNEKLEEQNKELQKNRENLEATNQQLLQQRQELEKAFSELSDRNYELDQIMYKTSHDLRSPLTSILGLLTLAKSEKDPNKLPEYHRYIEDRVLKLDNFVKSMLAYAKTSRTEIILEEVDWEQVVAESLSNLEYLSNYGKIHISKECQIHGGFKSDLLSLKVIFNNLVGNAIKYADLSKEEPFIRIRVNVEEYKAVINIEDNGIGIEPQYLDRIGKMFFRATERSEGSGLGMYIVKQAVEKMGGSVQVSSLPGKGTTIIVQLLSPSAMAISRD